VWWAAAPAAFLAVFLAWPLATVLRRGLDPGTVGDVLGGSSLRGIAAFTAWQALLSTLLSVAVGLPAAWALARVRLPGRRALAVALTIPFVLPTVVVAGAFGSLFDATGLRLERTLTAVLAAHVFFNAPVVVRTVGGAWSGLDRRPEDAARVLGAGRLRVLLSVTAPRLWPAVLAASSLVYLFSFTSFGVVLLLGGPAMRTLETEIHRQALVRTDLAAASVVAAIQLLAVAALAAASTASQRRMSRPGAGGGAAPATGRRASLAAAAALTPMLLLSTVPVVVMAARSFRARGGWGLSNYRALTERVPLLPVSAADALRNSLEVALVATLVATTLGLLAALAVHRPGAAEGRATRLLDVAATLPAGVSAVALGLGMLLTFDTPPLALRSSWWIVPLAHALLGMPFVVRAVLPALRAVDPHLPEAARTLGAAPLRVVRDVELALVRRSVAVGAAFAFAVSIGEFGASTMIARRPDELTAPLALGRLLSQPGEALRGQAAALATCLATLTALAVAVFDRVGAAADHGVQPARWASRPASSSTAAGSNGGQG
jgi:thiamine transport system permease protein